MLGSVTSVTFVNRTGGQGLIATHRTHRIGTHETLPHRIAGDLPIGHQYLGDRYPTTRSRSPARPTTGSARLLIIGRPGDHANDHQVDQVTMPPNIPATNFCWG